MDENDDEVPDMAPVEYEEVSAEEYAKLEAEGKLMKARKIVPDPNCTICSGKGFVKKALCPCVKLEEV